MLLGCDYTLGVKGIGIVNALEIIHAYGTAMFPEGKRPEDFVWINQLRKLKKWAGDVVNYDKKDYFDEKVVTWEFHEKHRGLRPHWVFPPDFPDEAVWSAFIQPVVDRRTDGFEWGQISRDMVCYVLRRYRHYLFFK